MNKARLQQVLRNMKAAGLYCTIVSDPHSIFYLTGRMIHPGERMLALVLYSDGRTEFFVNRLFPQAPEEGLDIIQFDDTDDCVEILSRALPSGKIGIDKNWPSRFTIRLMEQRPDILPVLGSMPVDDARMIKSKEDADLMRVSSHLNDQAVGKLIETIREGDSELDLAARYVEIGRELGAKGASFSPLICFGANGAEPHHSTGATRLSQGDMIILDLGLNVDGSMSDMTRTVVLGKATDEQREVYEIVKSANAAGRAAVAPGVPLKEIDRAARDVIVKAGYGDKFIHRTGHGIGLEVHEHPDNSAASRIIAKPGMCFSVEPGIYLPGKFGVRVEDLVVVTEDGVETLNRMDHDFKII